MEFRSISRESSAFQQPVSEIDIQEICARAFGPGVLATSAVELGGGMYNTTYRITAAGLPEPVILRIAPAPDRQFASERELMRNEYATVPYLSTVAAVVPRMLFADWSQEIIGRDWVVQSHLTGVPAPERLGAYDRALWRGFFAQLGEITSRVHSVRGAHFGPIAGPGFPTWSAAVLASLHAIAADLSASGLDAADVRKVADLAAEHGEVLDEIREPRLLTGDLWTVH
ncbi:phosphotransferase family protein [Streptomyces sp. NPDC001978]|uniref:phosphotransferase family protein n=1 Tax=Streptomyces sp. NPDC001978 TaxID=3364627 RepID=UPI0036C1FBC3